MCPPPPQKERWRGETCMCEKGKRKKKIPGSSLIEAPDVAEGSTSRENKEISLYLREERERGKMKEGKAGGSQSQSGGQQKGGKIIKKIKEETERDRREEEERKIKREFIEEGEGSNISFRFLLFKIFLINEIIRGEQTIILINYYCNAYSTWILMLLCFQLDLIALYIWNSK